MLPDILIIKSTISAWEQASAFASEYGLIIVDIDQKTRQDFALVFDFSRVYLLDCRQKKPVEIFVDFNSGAAEHRRKYGGGAGQAIAKACGIKGGRKLHILDATAGLGGDSFVMASLGCTLTLLERSPVAFSLLNDALHRANESDDIELIDIASRMTLYNVNALDVLSNKDMYSDHAFDVIYLDPMFPEKNKKALAKKEMQIFQQIVGADDDAGSLLEPALEAATYRVVVKRSKTAPYLNGVEPTLELKGKSSRFDIYTKKKLP